MLPSRTHLALCLLSCLALPLACGAGSAKKDQPVVIVLLCDTLRRDALSCYGNERIATPGFDSIAAEGTRFEEAISSSGWTLPSVASLLTGTWPSVHKAGGRSARFSAITPDLPLAQEVLQRAGFRTLAFVNAAFLDGRLGLARGFDLFDHEDVYVANIRRADVTLDKALLEIDRANRDAPVFALVHLFDPHLNYDPPKGWDEGLERNGLPNLPITHEKVQHLWPRERGASPDEAAIAHVHAAYEAEVAFVDAQVARFVAELKKRGLWDRALVVVVADHGEEFWEHGTFEHGHTLYDELIRVPLIVKLPLDVGPVQPVSSAQVRTLDLFPTVFDVLRLETPPSFVGESLMPMMRDASAPSRIAFSEWNLYGDERIAWRTDPFKYVLSRSPNGSSREELYDWRTDPGELHDLSGDPRRAELLERLRREAAAFLYSQTEKGAKLGDGPTIDLSPSANDNYLEWIEKERERLRALGYVGRDGE